MIEFFNVKLKAVKLEGIWKTWKIWWLIFPRRLLAPVPMWSPVVLIESSLLFLPHFPDETSELVLHENEADERPRYAPTPPIQVRLFWGTWNPIPPVEHLDICHAILLIVQFNSIRSEAIKFGSVQFDKILLCLSCTVADKRGRPLFMVLKNIFIFPKIPGTLNWIHCCP